MLITPFKLNTSEISGLDTCKEVNDCFTSLASEFLPLTGCILRGFMFPCPAQSARVLARMYGADWWTPEAEEDSALPREQRPMDNPTDARVSPTVQRWHVSSLAKPEADEVSLSVCLLSFGFMYICGQGSFLLR